MKKKKNKKVKKIITYLINKFKEFFKIISYQIVLHIKLEFYRIILIIKTELFKTAITTNKI